jgi:hypothetical protein
MYLLHFATPAQVERALVFQYKKVRDQQRIELESKNLEANLVRNELQVGAEKRAIKVFSVCFVGYHC